MPHGPAFLPFSPTPGPWFPATYPGDCDNCGEEFEAGDLIRADGNDGWQGSDCCGHDDD